MNNSRDIFLWWDGFWCYREESGQRESSRSYDYRVVYAFTTEWFALTAKEAMHEAKFPVRPMAIYRT
jgi:hypothetical protein